MADSPRTTAIDGAITIIVVLVVIQMWIVTASLESYLAGHAGTALAGAIASGLVFAACGGLYLFIRRVDREAREAVRPDERS